MIDLESVSPRTVAVTTLEKSGNAGGIAMQDFSVAIDSTKSPKTGKIFKTALEEYFELPVKFLVLTHHHPDHRLGIPSFKSVPIACSEKTLHNIPKGARSKMVSLGFKTSLLIKDYDLTVEICCAGGHTSGSSFVYFPHEKIVFAGDLIFEHSFPYAGDKTCNPDEWIAALEYIKSLDVQKIVPGHGPVLTSNGLDTHINFLKSLSLTVKEGVEKNKRIKIEVPEPFKPLVDRRESISIKRLRDYYRNLGKS